MSDVDHIVPKRAGGGNEWANLRALCRTHHARKTRLDATRYPS